MILLNLTKSVCLLRLSHISTDFLRRQFSLKNDFLNTQFLQYMQKYFPIERPEADLNKKNFKLTYKLGFMVFSISIA